MRVSSVLRHEQGVAAVNNLQRAAAGQSLPRPANRPLPAQRLRAVLEDRRVIFELQRARANDNTPSARAVVRLLTRVGFALVAVSVGVLAVLLSR